LYSGPLELMFEDDVLKDVVHHGLERCWGVGESEVHDGGFKESMPHFESRFPFVPFFYAYVVIPPSNVQFCVNMGVTEVLCKV